MIVPSNLALTNIMSRYILGLFLLFYIEKVLALAWVY